MKLLNKNKNLESFQTHLQLLLIACKAHSLVRIYYLTLLNHQIKLLNRIGLEDKTMLLDREILMPNKILQLINQLPNHSNKTKGIAR